MTTDVTVICTAENPIGEINFTFNIFVKKPPKFQATATSEQRFNVHDNFSLDCAVDGYFRRGSQKLEYQYLIVFISWILVETPTAITVTEPDFAQSDAGPVRSRSPIRSHTTKTILKRAVLILNFRFPAS